MKMLSLALAGAIALLLAPVSAQSLEADLQRAVQKELVSGDPRAAIEEYRRIAARAGENRAVKAKALLRMADSYRKLGDAESRKLYEQVVKEFGDQKDAVAEARTRLGASTTAVRASGPAARQIWSGEDVDPMGQASTDGRVLTYTNWLTGDLALRDLTTGANRHLTNTGGWEKSGDFAEFSVPSPDGRQIAYAWYTEKRTGQNYYDLRVLSIANGDGAKPRVMQRPDDLYWIMPCSWTPDGRQLVVYRERTGSIRELGLVTVATGAFRLLKVMPFGAQRANVSPDGRWIVYDTAPSGVSTERDLFIMNIDGSGDTLLDGAPANDQMPMWTADGSHVLFLSDRAGANGLWSIRMTGGKPSGPAHMVKQDVGSFYPLGLSRGGGMLYFVGGDRFNNYVAPVDAELKLTGAPAPLTNSFVNSNIGASWSHDGQQVAFYAFRGRETQGTALVVRDMKSGREREIPLKLQVPRGNAGPVRWFPDGQSVLVVGRDAREEGLRYYRVTLATGAAVDLVHRTHRRGPSFSAPSVTPDGRSIIYLDSPGPGPMTGDARTLRRFDIAARQDAVLQDALAMAVAVSPDGGHLAYLFRAAPDSRESEIAVMPIAGGEPRVVYRSVWLDASRLNTLGWSRDGRYVMFVRREDDGTHHLWRVPAAGGAAQKTGLSARGQMKAPQVNPDGTRLLYSVRDLSENSVWILENFLPPKS